MAKFEIWGPNKLKGEITVFGAKNAAMKMIAAAVLIQGEVTLENVPDILDIQTIINILTKNGAMIMRNGHTLKIDTTQLSSADPDPDLVRKMRGSIVLTGPYLTRFGKISFPQPGGCVIGARPIDTHLEAFKTIGADISYKDDLYTIKMESNRGGIIELSEASVTATENIMMSQVLTGKETIIKNAASEPQIADLANFLNKAGAKISGAGTREIKISSVRKLKGTQYKIMPDPFEASTFVCMATVTNSPLKITNCNPDQMYPFLNVIKKIGIKFERGNDFIYIKETANLKAANIVTAIHPGFSTDMQAPIGLVLTQANGDSPINETLYENRLGYLKELVKMGAKVDFIDCHKAIIHGPTKLHGAKIDSLDLRAGATLILAGLAAEGETVISEAEIIDRGYEKIEERLQKIGAKIKRV